MKGQPPADALPNLNVFTTHFDPDSMLAGHSGQRPSEAMSNEGTQDRAFLALEFAATSGFMKSVNTTEESCLTLCNTCRDKVSVPRLRIRHRPPPSIMQMVYPGMGQAKADDSSRVEPHRGVLHVDWRFNDNRYYRPKEDKDENGTQGEVPREEPNTEDHTVNDQIDISKIKWPTGTLDISLTFFNRRIDAMAWPPVLERLSFEHRKININRTFKNLGTFNMPLDAVTLPGCLREIFLGNHFNQPIEGVAWPRGLERLSLPGFNRSIRDVQWPPGLKSLEFVSQADIGRWSGQGFEDRLPCADNSSPKDRGRTIPWRHYGFNQPLGTTLPPSLETLWLPDNFDQPLHDIAWPSGIIFLGLAFRSFRLLPGIISWPPNLQNLCMSEKPRQHEGFSYPSDCTVTILTSYFGGDTNFDYVKVYDPNEDPNDPPGENEVLGHCYVNHEDLWH